MNMTQERISALLHSATLIYVSDEEMDEENAVYIARTMEYEVRKQMLEEAAGAKDESRK